MFINQLLFIFVISFLSISGCSFLSKNQSYSRLNDVTTIVLGSCADQDLPQPFWRTLLQNKPEIFLFMGDNVYASTPEKTPIDLQYEKLAQNVEFQKFRSEVPIFPIWDDHDYGKNDGGGDWNLKQLYKESFLRFWDPAKKLISREQDGLYYSKTVTSNSGHHIHLIFLDMRFNRSPLTKNPDKTENAPRFIPNSNPNSTFLGDKQWLWLSEQLRQPADFHILISSTQVFAESHGFEKWGNFPLEKQKLLSLIQKSGIKNLLLLSGDRHLGVISRSDLPGWGPLTEFTSSGLNKPSLAKTPERDPTYLEEAYIKLNFGLLQFDWSQRKVQLQLRNQSNEIVRSAEVPIF